MHETNCSRWGSCWAMPPLYAQPSLSSGGVVVHGWWMKWQAALPILVLFWLYFSLKKKCISQYKFTSYIMCFTTFVGEYLCFFVVASDSCALGFHTDGGVGSRVPGPSPGSHTWFASVTLTLSVQVLRLFQSWRRPVCFLTWFVLLQNILYIPFYISMF